MRKLWQIISSIALPLVVLVGGAAMMSILSGHRYVNQLLREKADHIDRKPLNMRVLGYDTTAVARHWDVLDERALQSERRFLELDLIFPTFYGAALAFALWLAWAAAGTTFSPVWIIVLVAITMIADWTENLIHLSQLQLYMQSGHIGLQPGWIQIASVATSLKLLLFFGILALTMFLTARKYAQKNKGASFRGA